MKFSQKSKSTTTQKDEIQHKSSPIFIQMGLVLSLILVYWVMEAKTAIQTKVVEVIPCTYTEEEEAIPEVPIDEPLVSKPQPAPDMSQITVVIDTKDITDKPIIPTDVPLIGKLDLSRRLDDLNVKPEKDELEKDFINVEIVPTFPGCKGNNEELKKCFSQKVNDLVNEKFDASISDGLSLSGKQRISVQFVVDQMGAIVDLKVKAPHKRLEKETIRVIGLLPQMKPGMQQETAIRVRYTLPIVFNIGE
jgi:protein TonB